MDLLFVLSNLASLTALPVRIVVGEKIEKRYSVVSFPIDPFAFHLKKVEERKSQVSFFYTKDFLLRDTKKRRGEDSHRTCQPGDLFSFRIKRDSIPQGCF